MPAKWQQWYAHDIDSWQGSATIQDLSDGAYRAVHNLIQYQFQSEDGMLPADENELAKLSRKRSIWPQIRDEVMDCFENNGAGRVYNPRMYREWVKAHELHEKRKIAAKDTNKKRINSADREKMDGDRSENGRSAHGDRTVTVVKTDGDRHTYTKTKTITNTEKTKATPRKSVSEVFLPPGWVPSEAWEAFVEMRKKIRAPLTNRAAERTVRQLEMLHKLGHDPGEVLDQSTQMSWRGVFETRKAAAPKRRYAEAK